MREMLIDQQDVFHYITLMNESYAQADLPEGAAQGVLRGGYLFKRFEPRTKPSTPGADTHAATPSCTARDPDGLVRDSHRGDQGSAGAG